MTQADQAFVQARDLSMRFDVSAPWLERTLKRQPRLWLNAVQGISFDIERGKTLALVGESGCGKSTVARMLVGLYAPTQGVVKIAGVTAPQDRSPQALAWRRQTQMIFQDP